MAYLDDMEKVLIRLGLPRTRENFITMAYVDLPEGWDEDLEEELVPPDLRLYPAPDVPLPLLH